MKILLPSLAFLALLVSADPTASAQRFQLFGGLGYEHLGTVPDGYTAKPVPVIVLPGTPTYTEQYTSKNSIGLAGGVTYRLLSAPLVQVGLDARGFTHTGLTKSTDSGLFGVVLAASKPIFHLKPYVEGAAGFQSVREPNLSPAGSPYATTTNSFASHFAVYSFFAGVDRPVNRFLDIRVVEIGGGSSFGAQPNTSLFSVETGAVLRF